MPGVGVRLGFGVRPDGAVNADAIAIVSSRSSGSLPVHRQSLDVETIALDGGVEIHAQGLAACDEIDIAEGDDANRRDGESRPGRRRRCRSSRGRQRERQRKRQAAAGDNDLGVRDRAGEQTAQAGDDPHVAELRRGRLADCDVMQIDRDAREQRRTDGADVNRLAKPRGELPLERGPHQVRSEHAVRKQIDAGRDHGQHNEYGNSDSAAHYG